MSVSHSRVQPSIPVLGEQPGAEGLQGLTDQPDRVSKLQPNERPCLQTQSEWHLSKDTEGSPLALIPYTHST